MPDVPRRALTCTTIPDVFEIGNSLREARVRQGLELPARSSWRRRSARKYLRALEEEEFGGPARRHVRQGLPAHVRRLPRARRAALRRRVQLALRRRLARRAAAGARPPRPSRSARSSAGRVLLALAGIAALTALVIVAWKFGGGDASTSTPSVVGTTPKQAAAPTTLMLRGDRQGARTSRCAACSAAGKVLLQGTRCRRHGRDARAAQGSGSTCAARQGVRVRLGGKPVALPARTNLRVVVTPSARSASPGDGRRRAPRSSSRAASSCAASGPT